MLSSNCEKCGNLIDRIRHPKSRFCSMRCCGKSWKGRECHPLLHPANNAGTIGELFVANYFLSMGLECFRSLSPASKTDLIIKKGDKTLSVEVKTGHYSRKGFVIPTPLWKKTNIFDVLAVYIPEKQDVVLFDKNLNPIQGVGM